MERRNFARSHENSSARWCHGSIRPAVFAIIMAATLFAALCLFATTASVVFAQSPADTATPSPPEVTARSVYLINADNGEVIYSLNPDEQLPMASTSKMMTALIVVEKIDDLEEMVTVSKRAAEVGESSVWLEEGESLTVEQLLAGMLIQSGNDAAVALAEYVSLSVDAFAGEMNERAAELEMTNSHFTNPHGLDDPDHYSSAADMARLGRAIMKHDVLRKLVGSEEYVIPWEGEPYERSLVNHNHLLGMSPAVNGIKTGFTDAAGQCIVVSASDQGVNLILAYLGGPSLEQRNQEVLALLDYGFNSYQEKKIISRGEQYSTIDVPYHRDKNVALVSDSDLIKQVFIGDTVYFKFVLPEELLLPVHVGDKVGLIEAYEGEKYLGSTYLVATEEIPKTDWRGQIGYYIQSLFNILLTIA